MLGTALLEMGGVVVGLGGLGPVVLVKVVVLLPVLGLVVVGMDVVKLPVPYGGGVRVVGTVVEVLREEVTEELGGAGYPLEEVIPGALVEAEVLVVAMEVEVLTEEAAEELGGRGYPLEKVPGALVEAEVALTVEVEVLTFRQTASPAFSELSQQWKPSSAGG